MKYFKKLVYMYNIMTIAMMLQSCKTSKMSFPDFFKTKGTEPYCSFLVFQTDPRIFIQYTSAVNTISSNLLGTWTVNKDTVICTPKIEYYGQTNYAHFNTLDPKDSTVITIDRKFLYRGNRMEDITDFSPIDSLYGLPLNNNNENKRTVYYRF